MKSIDVTLFEWMNDFAGQSAIVDGIMIFLSKWVIYLFIAGLIISSIVSKKRMIACIGLVSIVLGFALEYIISLIYERPRPFVAHEVILLINKEPSASFPSITAYIAFAAAMTIWLMNKNLGWLAFVIATFVAISRVYVGHHYPSDILGGSLFAVVITYGCFKIYERKILSN